MKVEHIATEGDYIIKGVQGEFYACKPDIFLQTYEQVEAKVPPSFLDSLIREYTTRTVWERGSEDFLVCTIPSNTFLLSKKATDSLLEAFTQSHTMQQSLPMSASLRVMTSYHLKLFGDQNEKDYKDYSLLR